MSSSDQAVWAGVTDQILDPRALATRLEDPRAGAVAQFVGVVRDHDRGRQVSRLIYHEHPTAAATIERLAREVAQRHPDALGLAAHHRIGELRIGDVALVAVVAAAHRGVAFDALRDLVETVKAELPIWKEQHFADGGHEWVDAL